MRPRCLPHLGSAYTWPLTRMRRGPLPSALDLDSAAKDALVQRTPPNTGRDCARRLSPSPFPSPSLANARLQSASGISFKSQFLYLIVYVTRYLDLLWTFYVPSSLYNTVMKIIFISTSAYTVYLMLNDYKPTHDPNLDTFKVQFLLAASAVMAILFPYKYTFSEVRTPCFAIRGHSSVARWRG